MLSKGCSPSRRYVAICNKTNFDGHYFKSFTLPAQDDGLVLTNDAHTAAWYFLNRLNPIACIDGCFAAEDFADVREQGL